MADAVRINLPDLAATHALGRRLARALTPGDVVALVGALGSGKTELARATIRARARALIEVPSPTFTLVQDYDLADLTIRHVDLYRIDEPTELDELGVDDPDGAAVLIEWPDRAGDRLPEDRLEIRLDPGVSSDARIATIRGGASWRDRLPALLDD